VAVNVSAMAVRNEKFLEGIFAILKDTGLDPRFLELELTESVLMKRPASTESILKTLRARGVQLAVDDFGTGYSSLSYLRKFSMVPSRSTSRSSDRSRPLPTRRPS